MKRMDEKEELLRVLHTTESTYTTISEEEAEDFSKWLSQRDIVYIHSLKTTLIKDHPIIQVMYRRLVPSVVSDTSFWNNYFYHLEKNGYKKAERELLRIIKNRSRTYVYPSIYIYICVCTCFCVWVCICTCT